MSTVKRTGGGSWLRTATDRETTHATRIASRCLRVLKAKPHPAIRQNRYLTPNCICRGMALPVLEIDPNVVPPKAASGGWKFAVLVTL